MRSTCVLTCQQWPSIYDGKEKERDGETERRETTGRQTEDMQRERVGNKRKEREELG